MIARFHQHERAVLNALAILAYIACLAAGAWVTHQVGTAAALVGAIAAWTFVVTYWNRPWRQYPEGRHLMAFTMLLAVILSYVSVRAATGTHVLALSDEAVRLFVYGSIAAMLLWRVRLLVDAQRD